MRLAFELRNQPAALRRLHAEILVLPGLELAGDEVLRAFARQLKSSLRQADIVCRWGGEEFILLLKDTDSATAAARSPAGIALHAAASGQPLTILQSGPITIGATVAVGISYWLSGTAGGICPVADVAAGDYPCIIGIGTSTSVIKVQFLEAGAVMV